MVIDGTLLGPQETGISKDAGRWTPTILQTNTTAVNPLVNRTHAAAAAAEQVRRKAAIADGQPYKQVPNNVVDQVALGLGGYIKISSQTQYRRKEVV